MSAEYTLSNEEASALLLQVDPDRLKNRIDGSNGDHFFTINGWFHSANCAHDSLGEARCETGTGRLNAPANIIKPTTKNKAFFNVFI